MIFKDHHCRLFWKLVRSNIWHWHTLYIFDCGGTSSRQFQVWLLRFTFCPQCEFEKIEWQRPESGRQNAVRWKIIRLSSALRCAFGNSDSVEKSDVRRVWGRRICQSDNAAIFFDNLFLRNFCRLACFVYVKNCTGTDNLQQRITLRNRYLVIAAFCTVRYTFVAIIIATETTEEELSEWMWVTRTKCAKILRHTAKCERTHTHTRRPSLFFIPPNSECVWKDVHFS